MIVKGFKVNPEVPSWNGFWERAAAGAWEPHTFSLMDRFLTPGWRWVDIGAWIGPTALYAAYKGAVVDAYECDPTALRALRANMRLNPNLEPKIRVHEYALGATHGTTQLWSSDFGNSESTLARVGPHQTSIKVNVRNALEVFRDTGYAGDDKLIVKMDIEGSEFVILPMLKDVIALSSCIWLVSFHEMNIVPVVLPERPVRIGELLRTISVFADLNWYSEDMRSINKRLMMEAILNGTERLRQPMVFRRGSL